MFEFALTGFILVAITATCAWFMRRPGANRKGLLSLMFALITFPGAAMLSRVTKEWGVLPNAVLFAGLLAALITALWALVEIERHPGRFKSGSVQAVVSLFVLSILAAQAVYILMLGTST